MDQTTATEHWKAYGMDEGRMGARSFYPRGYLARNRDVSNSARSEAHPFRAAVHHYLWSRTNEPSRDAGVFNLHEMTNSTRSWRWITTGPIGSPFSPVFMGNYSWAKPYLAVFNGETWDCGPTAGDSLSARYGTAFNFGMRSNTADANGHFKSPDVLVGRSTGWDGSPQWDCSGGDIVATSNYLRYGASNGQILKKNTADPTDRSWALYWLDVIQEGGAWRHKLMLATVNGR